ncbi:MFS transporter [Nocardia tengchongensis]|uniref:MFS transporter n=1 Tax=Nocardia tengchongensis TaxID=2055889 RepID=UPI003693644A
MTTAPTTHRKPTQPLTHALVLACAATFLVYLDAAIVNLAFGAIAAAFPTTSQHAMTWIATGYAVAFAAVLAVGGRLSDALGHRRLLLVGAIGFGLASAACAAAPTASWLIGARVVQGGTGALMLPAALGGLLAITPPARAAAIIGAWGAAGSLAAVLGPVAGAEIVDIADWRWLFLINVPATVALVAACRRLPAPPRTSTATPDVFGAVLLAGGLGALVTAISQSSQWGYRAPLTLGVGLAGLAGAGVALWRSRSQAVPVIPVHLLFERTFAGASLANAALGAALFTNMLGVPLFLTVVWHLSLIQAGAAFAIIGVAAMAGAVATGRSARVGSAPWFAAAGMVLVLVQTLALAFGLLGTHRSWPVWTVLAIIAGIGVGVTVSALSLSVSAAVSAAEMAVGMGVTLTARQVGGAVGLAVLAAVLAPVTSPRFVASFHDLFAVVAILVVVLGVAALLLLRARPPVAVPSPARAQKAIR